jgi:hypothetical protein
MTGVPSPTLNLLISPWDVYPVSAYQFNLEYGAPQNVILPVLVQDANNANGWRLPQALQLVTSLGFEKNRVQWFGGSWLACFVCLHPFDWLNHPVLRVEKLQKCFERRLQI